MSLPDWTIPRSHLTRDDVIASGACIDGVDDWMLGKSLRASMSVKALLKLADDTDHRYIKTAANMDGNGTGTGYGDGYGNGNGNGNGYGNG